MRLTDRDLNRATLHRQLLLRREPVSVAEAVRAVTALQAQEPASPYLALWSRVAAFEPTELDQAFADGTVVKASLMRITLHAVTAGDYPAFHAAMRPSLRASRIYDRRFTESGLSPGAVDAHEPTLLAASRQPRTSAEMTVALREAFGETADRAWWAYRTYLPLHHSPTGGPWTFGRRSAFVAAPRTLPPEEHEPAVDELVRRYLRGFGPAGVADVAQFTLLARVVVRASLHRIGSELVRHEAPDGEQLYDLAEAEPAPQVRAPARLLPMWESSLLAYADRSRILPSAYRPTVIRRNGDVLATLLVDGYVAGVWRMLDGMVEVSAFQPLSPRTWAEVATEVAGLRQLLAERDPGVYGRYGRWWVGLPAAEVRRLPS